MKTIIFFGSGHFAIPSLQQLLKKNDHSIIQVVSQPPRATGRKHTITPTPLHQFALEQGLSCVTNHGEIVPADVGVVVYYGRIIEPHVLNQFQFGCINLHPSLLPRWRGPSPIISALLAGDTTTGVTIMKLDQGVDTGPILLQQSVPIELTDTATTLENKLSIKGADCLSATLTDYLAGQIIPRPQPDNGITHSKLLKRSDGLITRNMSRSEIIQHWRALQPWPGIYCIWQDQSLKLCNFDLYETPAKLTTVQIPGKKPAPLSEFLHGHDDFPLPQLL